MGNNMPRKYIKSTRLNNIHFIATYIFVNPLCTAVSIRRALYYNKNGSLDNFPEKYWASSYFYGKKNHRGYPTKHWHSPSRGKWLLNSSGMKYVRPELIDKIKLIQKKCADIRIAG